MATAAYAPEPAAVAAARRFVRETLRDWELTGPLIDDAVLLTSELVTNAVLHAGTPVQVTCRLLPDGARGSVPAGLPVGSQDDLPGDRRGAAVEIAVLDWRPLSLPLGSPRAAPDMAEQVSGRGLLLPHELALAWGVAYARAAKAVWFRLAVAEPACAAPVPASPPGSCRTQRGGTVPAARPPASGV